VPATVSFDIKVKICGLTNVADALAAVAAGADAIGLVFYAPSPRAVDIKTAAAIATAAGPFVTTVGLFVNADKLEVERVLARVPLQLLQFHGDESPQYCEQFQRPYMKALRMRPELDVNAEILRFDSAQGILLDAYCKGIPGGTGETFDWQRVPASSGNNSAKPIVLAGGLDGNNIAAAIAATIPYGVDVSGGIEASAGVKDHKKIYEFIARAKA
jgi:phosphoribosylanthranilate isomerase